MSCDADWSSGERLTGEADEEVGDVEHVGGETRGIVVHLVLFAALVGDAVEEDVHGAI